MQLITPNTLVFLWIHCELETKTVFKFPAFRELTKRDVISFISDNFPIMKAKNSDFNVPVSQKCFVQFAWNFRICLLISNKHIILFPDLLRTKRLYVYLILNKHIRLKEKKMCKVWFIWPFKDVRAHCYCASLLRTLFIKHARATSFSSARTESKTQQKHRAGDLGVNLMCQYFCWMLGDPHFFSADHFLFWFSPLY